MQTIGQSAFEAGNHQAAIAAERAATNNLDLLSRVLGLIIHKSETQSTSLLISPSYLELRHTLFEALRPFPDAMAAVGKALHELESKAADDITARANGGKPLTIEHRPEETAP